MVNVDAITEIATSFVPWIAACFGSEPRSIWVVTFSKTTIGEPLALTARDVSTILQDCGVALERVENFQKKCDEQFGAGAALSPANLIDSGRFQVKTSQATLSLQPENSYLVETRIINGKKYILIPAEEDVEVNGLAVRFPAGQDT